MVATGGTFPNEPGGLRCAACSRGVTLPDLFDHFAPTKPKKMELLKKILMVYRVSYATNLPPFLTGGVGFFSYDLVHQFEDLPILHRP